MALYTPLRPWLWNRMKPPLDCFWGPLRRVWNPGHRNNTPSLLLTGTILWASWCTGQHNHRCRYWRGPNFWSQRNQEQARTRDQQPQSSKMVENSKEEELPSVKEEQKTDEKQLKTVSGKVPTTSGSIHLDVKQSWSTLEGILAEDGPWRCWLVGEWLLGFYTGRDISLSAFSCRWLHISYLVNFSLTYTLAFLTSFEWPVRIQISQV